MGQKKSDKIMKMLTMGEKTNQKTNNELRKQINAIHRAHQMRQMHPTRNVLSDEEIDGMLASDERVDKLYNMLQGKQVKEAYDMDRASRWGKRNGYELNGNVLSNGEEDMTFTDDGEFDSSSSNFPSSDFEEYMKGTPLSSDELIKYVGSKFGNDYRFTQAIAGYDEEAMSDIANDMSEQMDCTPEEALDAIHKFANEYAYYNPSEEGLDESAKKSKIRITEQELKNIISESVEKLLNEEYFDPQIKNPGMVKNNRVKNKGFSAQFYGPGKNYQNDSTNYVFKKHSGGKNAKRGVLGLYYKAIVGDADAAREFFRAIKYIPKIDMEFSRILRDYREETKSKKNVDPFDYI